ncbi:HEAT repeat domain-containing protein [Peribacillus sp. SCS-37]|uniref:HEAT repeat domain-containing protein n=1 Tax=Paraperibacillus esterisolvens TaxID=3115296 RepID=UPI003905C5AF
MNLKAALINALDNGRLEEAASLIEKAGQIKDKEAVPLLINYLKSTENHNIRNLIALALSDIGDGRAVKPLIEMINDPKTSGNRGTLLYALKPFDCSPFLETLIRHLLTGNFEVQLTSFELIEENVHSPVSDEVLLNTILKVKNELSEIERKKDLYTEALEMICSLKRV